jgi:hypothetical protein
MPQAHYINDPSHWRERAREMRSLAEHVKDENARKTMLHIAGEYELLAKRAEQQSDSWP